MTEGRGFARIDYGVTMPLGGMCRIERTNAVPRRNSLTA